MTLSPVTTAFRPVSAEPVEGVLTRLTAPAYADGTDAPTPIPVAADSVAFEVFSQGDADIPNSFDLSALWIFWGQFVDHDLDLNPEQEGADAELLKDAPPFSVIRSEFEHDADGVRQQFNTITPEIDASNVYGSDLGRQEALRLGEGGRLLVTDAADGPDLLVTSDVAFGTGGDTFVAGDIRAAENIGLTSIHTVWVNEHNHWAERFAAEQPGATDEEIFQQARAVVESLIQKITYEEFLPVLLGDALPEYAGYTGVDTQITTEFSTAAYRFGHTSIPDRFVYLGEDGDMVGEPDPLFDAFDTGAPLIENGLAPTLRGLLEERSQAIDTKVVDSLNFFLFTPDGGLSGFSLPERNILRGNDHGIDTWLNVRAQVVGDVDPAALSGSTDFSVISSDPDVQADLAAVYDSVDQVHLWVGGLAEDYVPGTTLGVTFQMIQADVFARVRDGDPFFYLNREWTDQNVLEEILDTSLADVLMRSGGIDAVQRDAMLASDRQGGTDGCDLLIGDAGRDLLIGFDGRDLLRGKAGEDDLFGGDGRDLLRGGRGDDGLNGGDGSDDLGGGRGNDILAGGDGRDSLRGGRHDDQFVFVAGERGVDRVLDFGRGDDVLVVKGFDAAFEDVTLRDRCHATLVEVDGVRIAKLIGVDAHDLSADDGVFVA